MAQVLVPGSEMGKAKDSLSASTPHPIRQTPEPEEKEASQEEEEEGSGFCKPKGQREAAAAAAAAAALPPSPIIRAPRGIFGEGDAAAALPGHSGRNPRVSKGHVIVILPWLRQLASPSRRRTTDDGATS